MTDLMALARDSVIAGRLEDAGKSLTEHYGGKTAFELNCERLSVHFSVVKWLVDNNRSIITLHAALWDVPKVSYDPCAALRRGDLMRDEIYDRRALLDRLCVIFPLLAEYQRIGRAHGVIYLNLDDWGFAPGLGFSADSDDQFPIPNTDFIRTEGHKAFREQLAREPVPWERRQPVAFWRGSSTGVRDGDTWQTLPRIRLCEIAQSSEASGLFDVGISRVIQVSEHEAREIHSSGYIRDGVPATGFAGYRLQIDIDGNSSSWSGLFHKLLTGCPVLKVASSRNYREWYYDRLVPWQHYVPVEADMCDLVEKVRWTLTHEDQARAIGSNGATLANAMSYAAELSHAMDTITHAIRITNLTRELAATRLERDAAIAERDALAAVSKRWFDAVMAVTPDHNPLVMRRGKRFSRNIVRHLIGKYWPPAKLRADRARDAGEWELAIRYYRDALDLDPDNPKLWDGCGHALMKTNKISEAQLAYQRARKLAPKKGVLTGGDA